MKSEKELRDELQKSTDYMTYHRVYLDEINSHKYEERIKVLKWALDDIIKLPSIYA